MRALGVTCPHWMIKPHSPLILGLVRCTPSSASGTPLPPVWSGKAGEEIPWKGVEKHLGAFSNFIFSSEICTWLRVEPLPLCFLSPFFPSLPTLRILGQKECPESLDVLTSYEAKVLPDLLRCFLSCKTKRAVSAGWWLLGWEVSLSDLWCSSFSRFFPGNSGTFLQDVFTHSEWHPGDAEQE